MTIELKSDALDVVSKALGIGRSGGELSVFDDSFVNQVLALNDLVRRGRTWGASSGWFYCVWENVHPGAGVIDTILDPYDIDSQTQAPWEDPIPRGFDFWLLSGAVIASEGTGIMDDAVLYIQPGIQQRGFGEDNGGGVIITNEEWPIGFWDTAFTPAGATKTFLNTPAGQPNVIFNTRIGRGATLKFHSRASVAAVDIQLITLCGVFPVGLGQDIIAQ